MSWMNRKIFYLWKKFKLDFIFFNFLVLTSCRLSAPSFEKNEFSPSRKQTSGQAIFYCPFITAN